MRKIYPALSQYRRNKDGVASRWITTQNPELMAEFGYELRQLYTREALDAAAHSAVLATFEAIRDSGNYPASADMPDIDTAAIINQLTGE